MPDATRGSGRSGSAAAGSLCCALLFACGAQEAGAGGPPASRPASPVAADAQAVELLASAAERGGSGDLDGSARDAEGCVRLEPSPDVLGKCLRTLGVVRARQGDTRGAAAAFERYLPLCEPSDCEKVRRLIERFGGKRSEAGSPPASVAPAPAAPSPLQPAASPPPPRADCLPLPGGPAGAPGWVAQGPGPVRLEQGRSLQGVGLAGGSGGALQRRRRSDACARASLAKAIDDYGAALVGGLLRSGTPEQRSLLSAVATVQRIAERGRALAAAAPVVDHFVGADGGEYALARLGHPLLQEELSRLDASGARRLRGGADVAFDQLCQQRRGCEERR